MSFAPVKRLKLAEQVAQSIRDAILQGQLSPGDVLPSERTLAEEFGVNRSSVREALHRLEAWGLIEVRQGESTRVADFLSSAGLQLLPWLLAPGGTLDPELLRDLLELRATLLGWTASRATARGTPEEQNELRAILEDLRAATDLVVRQRRDFAFFEQLTAMSHNQVLGMVTQVVGQAYRTNAQLFLPLYRLPLPLHLLDDAVGAVCTGDAIRAQASMQAYGEAALVLFGRGGR